MDDLEIAERAKKAMDEVISSEVPEVGEAIISVDPSKGVFVYRKGVMRMLGRDVPVGEPVAESGAQRGDLSYTVLVPEEPGVGAIGIYFLEGQLGLLYHPMKCESPQRYRDVSLSGFTDTIQKHHGILLRGAGLP